MPLARFPLELNCVPCVGYIAAAQQSQFNSVLQYLIFPATHQTPGGYAALQHSPRCETKRKRGAIMLLASLVRTLKAWRRFNASLRELNRLGDRELADIGISRSDIPRVAWENAQH